MSVPIQHHRAAIRLCLLQGSVQCRHGINTSEQWAGGLLATSGNRKRFLLKDGVRYSHILNPLSGWPVTQAFPSVTVAGPTCVQCGLIATLALLQGPQAEAFLQKTGLRYWLVHP
ncbi:FAD:protein FMN transferase [Venatoribacter cucullus]|uniref:FAD:protein FMN transferase n=1 Tax=Venatoribacter cucullus TaxID=2661630 RepID=UPI00223FF5E4|nr:FAD:protein FMN transferase [Venatoribacter cucullus]UZK04418.1 hypothetical protein GAY96_11125 [Venatoribacter cucullus]